MSYLEGITNPYDGNSVDLSPETPDQGAVLREAMRKTAMGLRVCTPCSVAAVRGNQLVDVQPLLLSRYVDGSTQLLPVIPHALVCAPLGQGYGIKVPIAIGDTGLALFCDRSLDAWAAGSGGAADPQDCRAHDLNDAIFVPGLVPVAKQTKDTTSDMVLSCGQSSIRVRADGTFAIGNNGQELVSLVSQLASEVSNLIALLGKPGALLATGGPVTFDPGAGALLTGQKNLADAIVAHLATLKRPGQ